MKALLLFFLASLVFAQAPRTPEPEELAGGAELTITHNSRMRTIVCMGNNSISITGHGNVIVVMGACDSLTVSGSGNMVRVDGPCPNVMLNGNRNGVDVQSADSIKANGNQNHCRWRVGYSNPEPEVTAFGLRNVIQRWKREEAGAPPWGFYVAPRILAPPALPQGK